MVLRGFDGSLKDNNWKATEKGRSKRKMPSPKIVIWLRKVVRLCQIVNLSYLLITFLYFIAKKKNSCDQSSEREASWDMKCFLEKNYCTSRRYWGISFMRAYIIRILCCGHCLLQLSCLCPGWVPKSRLMVRFSASYALMDENRLLV